MAVDTVAKRFSAINYGMSWRGASVLPDGTVGQGDRQAVAFLYSGILAGGGITGFGRLEYTMPRSQLEYTMAGARLEYTMPDDRL